MTRTSRHYRLSLVSLPFLPSTALAPMEGLTTGAIRALLCSYGPIGLVCTEFVRVHRGPLDVKGLRAAVTKMAGVPLSVQLLGNDAEKLGRAANLLATSGADVVDINLGCPTKRAARGEVGAAMLKDLPQLGRVLDAVRRATPGLLSAKMRAGFDHANDALAIAKMVQDAGADFLVVHPRRRCDLFSGVADWRLVGAMKAALSIPVIGNGDVWYAADALRLAQATGCDAVMVGRPALRNPWIFRQIEQLRGGRATFCPTGKDVLEHLDRLAHCFAASPSTPAARSTRKLKEHLRWLGRSVPDQGVFLRSALRLDTLPEILELARQRLAHLGAGDLDLDAHGRYRLECSPGAP